MRIFVTGATGYIGSAVVQELINAGHKVIGLTRSDNGAKMLEKVGAEAHFGSLEDLECLRKGASIADGVIHLAFRHDFADFAGSLAIDLKVIETIGEVLEGTGKPFITTAHANGAASDNATLNLANKGVRASVVSLSPAVHGEGDKHAFIPILIDIARTKGVSAYVGDGSNRWPAIHRLDAAKLYRLALEKAPAGSSLFGRAEEGVRFYDIAETIGKQLNLPVVSISREEAEVHFGFLGILASLDIPSAMPASSAQTRELLGWEPEHLGLIKDIEQGHYFNK
ncbi:NAD-dependent epimerase/dehydratase [Clostridium sp. DL-VIII]|uniref:SDR family oxidoreductase n=1 Tax=Clostridium sp. DL-VIII TaxID=641107 RepID=UPI00023AF98B|nr:SDR family oxidoreductase [Clostridium sp. DL-VIII]EHJ00602.1 NAD-dependent epimerase/dehydratase [Clostridium sp. DL-VIII]